MFIIQNIHRNALYMYLSFIISCMSVQGHETDHFFIYNVTQQDKYMNDIFLLINF